MIRSVAELKGLLDFVYELRTQGKSSSEIRGELQNRYGLTLTDSQFQGLVRVVAGSNSKHTPVRREMGRMA